MFSVFLKKLSNFDPILINGVQWLLRQIELFTNITRKMIMMTTLTAYKISLLFFIASFFSYIIFFLEKDVLLSYLLSLNILAFTITYFDMKKIVLRKQKEGVIPVEIVSRKITRIGYLLLYIHCIFCSIVLSYVTSLTERSATITHSSSFVLLLILTMSIQIALEYLACTVSLPPGEKERRKVEKETRNMVSI